uniref:Uncharacterized protein n=1 Tax=Rhizophora mucronata TaxID=61149 RepID=A0A2P2PQY0_RHIMU
MQSHNRNRRKTISKRRKATACIWR